MRQTRIMMKRKKQPPPTHPILILHPMDIHHSQGWNRQSFQLSQTIGIPIQEFQSISLPYQMWFLHISNGRLTQFEFTLVCMFWYRYSSYRCTCAMWKDAWSTMAILVIHPSIFLPSHEWTTWDGIFKERWSNRCRGRVTDTVTNK